jgi:hypothetical protein
MELSIDSDKLRFVLAGAPEPLVRFDTLAVVRNAQGHAVYEADLVFLADGSSRIFPVGTTTEPKGLVTGQAVRPVELVVSTWEMDEGFVLWADAIESAVSMSPVGSS